ncbi:AfsR/SARP family transcriptional regulator [Streptomyces niveus]|uniref:Winged helix-turn-helix domain-containing protein n=1 Tax=Streptomyces niveus TaxID=193462 RepID=A0ABZ2AHG1_STRNV|nr:BTAD domain-containing putative transcriptional regulator [Streptomyces niveus]
MVVPDNGGVRYRLLGPTRALRSDGTPYAVGGARLRALLTALAMRPGRTVRTATLVDAVWDGDVPADAPGALQALVSRLRRALGAGTVVSDGGGYRLCAEPDDVDLFRFERLTAEGTRALDGGSPELAARLLDEALGLWDGPALSDLPHHRAESARWESRRLGARRARLTAALALGHAEEALPELAALCDEHPIDELLQALRIRALRAAGRPAEALSAYEDVRRDLSTRLGMDPGPELRTLYKELLNPDENTPHPRPAPPASPNGTAPGAAGLPAPAGDDHPADTGPPGGTAAGALPPGNLPARITSFVGRESDLADLRGDLRDARLVTLLGAGGAGKTRLSQEVAAGGGSEGWADGVWLAELAPVDDPETVPEAVLVALGARETVLRGAGAEGLRAVDPGAADPLVRLVEHCSRRRMLLLLDNCEHVVAAAARLVGELLARCPGVTVLATSREPLGVPGEVLRPVGPLPEPMALRLLADRGAAARPGFRTEDDPAAAEEICRRLDGLPLAIELAAARLRMLTPRQIADRLDDRFRLLTGGSRTVLPRQQTLRAVVDWSWDLLDSAERAALGDLSVFAGGCDLAAAEAVLGPDALELLGSLVDKSLVVASPAPDGAMRYRLLETVLEYAAQRLDESGGRAAAERRHLVHFRELIRLADPKLRGPEQLHWITRVTVEYENLRTALRHAVAESDEHEALCLVHSLAWYWQIRDLRAEARHWSRAAADLGPDPFDPPVTPAPPLYERCTDAPPPMAPEQLLEARRGARLINLANMNHEFDMWTTSVAKDWLLRVGEVYRPGLPQTCRTPGSYWFFTVMLSGEPGRLRTLIDATVQACRDFGYEWELAAALYLRANVLANRSEWAGDAGRDADESLEIFTRLGDAWGAAEALSARAEAFERNGDFERAAADFHAAIDNARMLGADSQVALLRTRLAGVMTERGDLDEAEAMLRGLLAQNSRRDYEAEPAARIYLALLLGRRGRVAEAREQLDRLSEDFAHSNLALFAGFVFGLIGWLENLEGRYAEGLARSREALAHARDPMSRMVAPQMAAVHLLIAGWSLAGLGGAERVRDGARLLAAYEKHLPRGHYRTMQERECQEAAEAAVHAGGLTGADYEQALAEGRALTLDEAYTVAGA